MSTKVSINYILFTLTKKLKFYFCLIDNLKNTDVIKSGAFFYFPQIIFYIRSLTFISIHLQLLSKAFRVLFINYFWTIIKDREFEA